jgi:aminoglycoside phosphotransferase (APT) family kinase protein
LGTASKLREDHKIWRDTEATLSYPHLNPRRSAAVRHLRHTPQRGFAPVGALVMNSSRVRFSQVAPLDSVGVSGVTQCIAYGRGMAPVELSIATAVSELLGEPAELVRMLSGGTHAETAVIAVADRELVARRFPLGDDAVALEVPVLERVRTLGALVPELVAYQDGEDPLIVTTKVEGGPPDPDLPLKTIAHAMAQMLAQVHSIRGAGLQGARKALPSAETSIARAARRNPPSGDPSLDVLVHGDFWCGNATWRGPLLTGLVDWSGARAGARGRDVSWCRQDLVLLGDVEAAAVFLQTYERASGVHLADLWEWDVMSGAWADATVESWAPNYTGIGRRDVTPEVLRGRLNEWNSFLLRGRTP